MVKKFTRTLRPAWPALEFRKFKQGLGFHNGELFWKRMERMHLQRPRVGFRQEKTERPGRKPILWCKAMPQVSIPEVEFQLLVIVHKDFGIEYFQLVSDVIPQPSGKFERFVPRPTQPGFNTAFPLGKQRVLRRCHLGQCSLPVAEFDHMARITDVERGPVSVAADHARTPFVEEFRMNGPPVNMEHQR